MEPVKPDQIPADQSGSVGLTPDAQRHTPALLNIGEAVALVRQLEAENETRSKKNARILEKYNSDRPYDPERLKQDGLSWKTNFTTKPLTTLIDKVVPRFTTALRNMRYLTASALPESAVNGAAKSEFFQKTITDTCRGHEAWDELLTDIAQETVLFGYASAGWLDSYTWFPKFYRQDAFLVPQGTTHSSKSAPVVCLKESYFLHELFEAIQDPGASAAAGWNVQNVIESLNSAVPEKQRSGFSDLSRVYADLSRESSVLSSFTGAKVVIVWHVFITEIDGHVTHVAFDNHSGKELFRLDKQFASMADAAAFFSFQHGNGKLHGSKGIGRELYNMAGVLDRSRNEVVDRLQLSGKLVINCDENQIKRFRMSVVGNAILIGSGYNIAQTKLDGAVEPFIALDRFLTELLDQVAGSTSPKAFEGERVTKAAVEVQTSREEERRDAIIERFLTQFARFMSTIQRRLCDPSTADAQAKSMQEHLLTVLSPEEVQYLSSQPAVATVADYSEAERQQIALIAAEGRGNPVYNQRELEKRSLTARVSAEFAESVLLPENDATEQAENTRQQQLESQLLQTGQQVPVSPRDNHFVHLQVLQQAISAMLEAAVEDPRVLHVMDMLSEHGVAHLDAAEAAGQGKAVAEMRAFFQKVAQTTAQLHQAEADAAAQASGAPPGAEAPVAEAPGTAVPPA